MATTGREWKTEVLLVVVISVAVYLLQKIISLDIPWKFVGPENATLTLNPKPPPEPITSGRPVPGENVPLPIAMDGDAKHVAWGC